MEYTIAYARDIQELIKEVNSLIEKGWLPQGGICYSSYRVTELFHQAMVKK